MRNVLAQRPDEYPQDCFFIPWCENLSINWPYDTRDCITHDEQTGQVVISAAFERHIRELDYWTLRSPFARALPSLVGTYRQS